MLSSRFPRAISQLFVVGLFLTACIDTRVLAVDNANRDADPCSAADHSKHCAAHNQALLQVKTEGASSRLKAVDETAAGDQNQVEDDNDAMTIPGLKQDETDAGDHDQAEDYANNEQEIRQQDDAEHDKGQQDGYAIVQDEQEEEHKEEGDEVDKDDGLSHSSFTLLRVDESKKDNSVKREGLNRQKAWAARQIAKLKSKSCKRETWEPCSKVPGPGTNIQTNCGAMYCTENEGGCAHKVWTIATAFIDMFSNFVPAPKALQSIYDAAKISTKAFKKALKKAAFKVAQDLRKDARDNLKTFMKSQGNELRDEIIDEILQGGGQEISEIAISKTQDRLKKISEEILAAVDPTGIVDVVKAFEDDACSDKVIEEMPQIEEERAILIREGAECKSGDVYLGRYDSLFECQEAVKRHGTPYFVYGVGSKKGYCYAEKTTNGRCDDGFENDQYDFYGIGRAKLRRENYWCAAERQDLGIAADLDACEQAVLRAGGKYFLLHKTKGKCYASWTDRMGFNCHSAEGSGSDKDYNFYEITQLGIDWCPRSMYACKRKGFKVYEQPCDKKTADGKKKMGGCRRGDSRRRDRRRRDRRRRSSSESCWVRLPTWCSKKLGETSIPNQWFLDPHSKDASACTKRLEPFNSYCSRSDAESHWGPPPVHTCNVGDAVMAVYAGDGDLWPAVIASVDGSDITVNWDDGDSTHRTMTSSQVFCGQACWVRLPTGCSKQLGETSIPKDWFIDPASKDESACTKRLSAFNRHCSRSNAKNLWRR